MECTTSPILFVLAMEVILRAAGGSASPADLGGGCYIPPLKTFIDDTTILSRRMLVRLNALMNRSRMSFKPKSRSLSIRKGTLDEDVCFKVVCQNIPESVKSPSRALEDGTIHP
ncbi:reverse transcriptase [Plakobranchus ocellatus]|uniref:Reverse transcriptase n=1 Tax=Plakobranchus ocellatus TaxID=259542 RepID=A0AAV4BUE7_9GAST|nr:reverse transcriptase [Plakobranchus ocellatus]